MATPLKSKRPAMSVSSWRSYVALMRDNPRFRRFWLAQIISQFGNWFNYIGVFVLLERLTGSGQAVSWFLIAKFLPTSILGPAAGVLADRFSRKAIMISADLLRVGVVLSFLLVRRPEHVWLVYVLALAQETLWTFANPARQASVPNLVNAEQLNIANALSGATWSILLAFGAALGGLVTAVAGWQTAIIIDSLTFLISALLIVGVAIPPHTKKPKSVGQESETGWLRYIGFYDMREGFRYVAGRRKVAALLFVKSGWALSGGILVMLVIFGEQVFSPLASGGGSGLLYSCRGVGAAIGPILMWRILGEESPAMMRGIAFSFFLASGAYILFSQAPNIWISLPFVLLGHIGGATQWVFSTTLLQRIVEDQYRGRVFAAEMAMVTLMLSLSTYWTGVALDTGYDPRSVALALALLFLVPGSFWQVYLFIRRRQAEPS